MHSPSPEPVKTVETDDRLAVETTGIYRPFIISGNELTKPDLPEAEGDLEKSQAPNSSQENLIDPLSVPDEKWWKFLLTVLVPFIILGAGTITAGTLLGNFKTWPVFIEVEELFILVPALMGLKGNLDMCLAARLSTQANLGNMSSGREVFRMVYGNIAVVQVQATVAAFLVGWFAIGVGAIMTDYGFIFQNAMLLLASSLFTATVSCFVLDFLLVAIILIANKLKLNPDNLATPFAAALGDIVAISVLAFSATFIYNRMENQLWITYILFAIYLLLLPMWFTLSFFNNYTRHVLVSGWTPILVALFISSLSGITLSQAIDQFTGIVVFQPIINGVGGSLSSIQASKISTMLHQVATMGQVPSYTKIFANPLRALFYDPPYAKSARILTLMSIPGAVLFVFAADFAHMGTSTIGAPFVLTYLMASLIQLCMLLYIAHIITHMMWKLNIDPDNATIPYLTALGDLIGSLLLLGAFSFLRAIGHDYGDEEETVRSRSEIEKFVLELVFAGHYDYFDMKVK